MTPARSLAAATLVMLSACTSAFAAELRPSVEIAGPDVRLSDLFSGLGPGQDCRLGDAPAPGRRLVIGQDQLAAIAAQFGVEWDDGRGWRTTTIDRPGRLIDDRTVGSALTDALRKQGVPPGETPVMGAWSPTEIDLAAKIVVRDAHFDLATGRYNAELEARLGDLETGSWPLAGQIDEVVRAVEPVHALTSGALLEADDLVEVGVPRRAIGGGETIARIDDAVGMVVRHAIAAGQPIRLSDLDRPELVRRGAAVLMHLEASGLSLTAQGSAIDGGALGEHIRVANPESGAILLGVVVATDEVQIEPESPIERLSLATTEQSFEPNSGSLSAR